MDLHHPHKPYDKQSIQRAPCKICWDLQKVPQFRKLQKFHYLQLCTFIEKSDCPGCRFLRDALARYIETCGKGRDLVLYRPSHDFGGLHLCDRMNHVLEFYSLQAVTFDNQTLSAPYIPVLRHISGDTGSEKAFSWALSELDCCLHHKTCSTSSAHPTLPTRILDLGDSDNGIKLYEGRKLARYICLSHCWGKTQPLKTTKGTHEIHSQSIPFSSFPKTFQDAIIFTRRLKIQYLWIDSLCIIQDDPEDWQRESSRMCSIFQNSFLTIAAAKSSGPSEGCSSKASKEYLGSPLEVMDSIGNNIPIYVRKKLPWQDLWKSLGQSRHFPLLDRAWVYQERLLSPRMLYFGAGELQWECATKASCECGRLEEMKTETLKTRYSNAISSGSVAVLHSEWRKIVSNYSTKKLTYTSDRLPALLGMARQFQHFMDGKYIAGVWDTSLSIDLLWYAPIPPPSRSAKGRVPTWSWASIEAGNNGVAYSCHHDVQPHFTLLHSSVQHAGLDDTGGFVSGYLKVSGILSHVTVTDDFSYIRKTGYDGQAKFDRDYDLKRDPRFWSEVSGQAMVKQEFYCLKICTEWEAYIHSLVLWRLSEDAQKFERVGLCSQYKGTPIVASNEPFLHLYEDEDLPRVLTIV